MIAAACRQLLLGGSTTLRKDGMRTLKPADIMVVAPYNLAVREIAAAVPSGVRVGTIDRFRARKPRSSSTP